MKYLITPTIILTGLLFAISGCEKEKEVITEEETNYAYHAHINSPNTDDKHVNDTIHLHVEAESHTGETVHHVNVRIYNKATNSEIYNAPNDAHVHESDGLYELHDDIILSNANGVNGHSNWVIETKVWGHHAGEGEVTETLEFHVHP